MPRHVHWKFSFLAAGLLALVVPSCAVLAQTKTEPVPGDPCSTQLQQQSPDDEGGTTNGGMGGQATADTSNRLSRCGDVLRPPKIGDNEFVKPAPEKGNMPVIKPKQVPEQQQNDPDAD